MHVLFIELSSFEKYRPDYLNDDQFRLFQSMLLADPEKGLPSSIKMSVTI